ncbi:MAG: TlpA family protein disulfide reductase [Candidatus Bathyarchaeota archaeon]|nr:TlpA family protein disulfide reductase [Candidatus Bathyarchaeota archaeon]
MSKKHKPYVLRKGKSGSYIVKKKGDNSKNVLIIIGVLIIVGIFLSSLFIYNNLKYEETLEILKDTQLSNSTASKSIESSKGEAKSEHENVNLPYPLAPDFTLIDIDGKKVALSEQRGKIVILDFMGAKCIPCKIQVGELGEVYTTYGDKVEILSISIYGGEGMVEELHSFEESFNVSWRTVIDDEGVAYKYQIMALPTTVIIDQDGYVRYQHAGVVKASTIVREINDLLGEY